MEVVLLVIHLLIAIGLICVVLLQRSEGGALGIGGGGGGGMSGFMTGRSAANLLTRITAVLAAMFFLTSMGLTWLSGSARRDAPIVTPGTTAKTSRSASRNCSDWDCSTDWTTPLTIWRIGGR